MFRLTLLLVTLALLPLGLFLSQPRSQPLSSAPVPEPVFQAARPAVGGVTWQPYDQALSRARSQGKPVYIQFHAAWCPYCKKLEKESYSQPAIQTLLNQDFVPVRLTEGDKTRYRIAGQSVGVQDLFLDYQVTGFPTLVFLEPDGKLIGKIPGYVEPADFQSLLRYIQTRSYRRMDFDSYRKNKSQS